MTDQNTNVHELKNKVSKFAQERNWESFTILKIYP